MHNKEYRKTFPKNDSPVNGSDPCSGVVSLIFSETEFKVNAEDVVLSAMINYYKIIGTLEKKIHFIYLSFNILMRSEQPHIWSHLV